MTTDELPALTAKLQKDLDGYESKAKTWEDKRKLALADAQEKGAIAEADASGASGEEGEKKVE